MRNGASSLEFAEFIERKAMSAWFRDDPSPMLLESALKIAIDFLDRSGEIDDYVEACWFLQEQITFMIAQGQRNKLLLANRAIFAFQRHKRERTIEWSLVS